MAVFIPPTNQGVPGGFTEQGMTARAAFPMSAASYSTYFKPRTVPRPAKPTFFGISLELHDISAKTQQHLSKVYRNVFMTVLMAAAACWMMIGGKLGEPGLLTAAGLVAGTVALALMKPTVENRIMRRGLMMGIGFLSGWGAGPLVQLALEVEPALVLLALGASAAVFLCFSVSALISPRRSLLYLGGVLASLLMVTSMLGLANMFTHSEALFGVQLYLGLAVLCGYVLFDTQLIVERSEATNGQADDILDATMLFTDLYGIFMRILLIMMRDKKEKSKRSSK